MAKSARWLAASRPHRLAAFLGRAVATRGAGFGLLVVSVVLLVALGADLIAPYDPNQMQPAGILGAPASRTGSAPTSSGGTS